ncbi:hypothetical protein [uncultured Thiodictyon sp.]|uniref:hypothetical protein n=1 Tax=uncultured Thiodictyon sp. TaxID=1846217 RepID=UPI0025D8F878|nr:hypothetical protein [uncultured Thiodictyon sp.]
MSLFPQDLACNPDLHRELFQDRTAIRLADRCARDIERFARRLNHGTIAALAQHRAPGASLPDALRQMADAINSATMDLARFQAATAATLKADSDRLAPLVSKATRRVLAAAKRTEDIGRIIRMAAGSPPELKRAKLRAAGVTGADLDALAKPFDPVPLEAESAALVAEVARLEDFLRTRDDSLLPAGFLADHG